VALLGYTNGVGPYALLAITNHSESPITLNSFCVVQYAARPIGSAPRRVTSVDGNALRVTRLGPGAGFVQDVFVFPGNPAEWEFEFFASRSSTWLELRRAAENWFQKHVRRARFPLRSKTWERFDTPWYTCPQ